MRQIYIIILIFLVSGSAAAQIDSSLLRRQPQDSATHSLNMDAVYNRPFLGIGKLPVSVGGYMEANWQHLGTDGVSDGHQFQFRRMTLFVSSAINRRLKFLSEIEFEDGAREISVEFAALDIAMHPMLNLRGGMILNPIGGFNQNHDGPKWEFTDRPIAMTQMLPATWSNAGFGLYGKYYRKQWMIGYEAYLSGGFDNSIVSNAQNKTYLPAAKANPQRFEDNASGEPLFTGKLAARHAKAGEIGISYMGGIYNAYRIDGIVVDERRRLDVLALDFNTTLPAIATYITAEWAWIRINVPVTLSQQFGSRQRGGFADIVQPLIRKRMLGWDKAVLNLACRFEYVDWNAGTFRETGGSIADDLWSIMPGVSFRPAAQTVLRLNYRHMRQRDLFGNPPARTGGFIFGISTYF